MAPIYATRADLDVYGSTISHIISSCYRHPNHSYFQYWASWTLISSSMDHSVVEDVWPHPHWLSWEPLIILIVEVNCGYSWIGHFDHYATSGSILLGNFMYVWNLSTWYFGELVHSQNSRGALNLNVAFVISSSATLIHTSAASHLVLSIPVGMGKYECF